MIAGNPHELPFRAQSFKEEGKLELEKDDWIDGWPPVESVAILDPVTDEAEIKHDFKLAVKVIRWNQRLKGDGNKVVEVAGLTGAEHRGGLGEQRDLDEGVVYATVLSQRTTLRKGRYVVP
jgi:hypothetical protein